VEINQLANKIREHGIRQPLTVVLSQGQIDKFEVISGERRLRAAQIVGLEVVPYIIIKDNEKAEEIALIENIQRSDLHPIEFSEAILSLSKNSKWGDISNIADKVGKPVSTISEAISIAKLPDDIKNHLIKNNIRSRDIIRKLTSLDYAQMKTVLGLEEGEKVAVQYSVLRITKNGDEYKIQDRGIKRLNNEERESLKKHLLNLLKKL
jgi:ParB family chromosome partitioning protein